MSSQFSAFGPGKIILLGEHGVVYGHPALAGAISRGVHATATADEEGPSIDFPEGLSESQTEVLERAFEVAVRKTKYPRVSVELNSDLPLSMGLGSSGALSVAISRVLLNAQTGKVPKPLVVEKLAFEMEKAFHGTPSGCDHTTSARGTLVLYQKGKAVEVRSPKPLKVLVALVGPRSATKSTVGALRDRQKRWPQRYRRVFDHIGHLVRDGVAAVKKGDLESLGDVMNMNQGMLASLGLTSTPIDEMVYRLREYGALGAKLTGAGGDGGAVIGLFPEPEPAVVKLRKAGIDCFASQLAGPRAL